MSYNVKYWTKIGKEPEKANSNVCFANLQYGGGYDQIRYQCRVYTTVCKPEALAFYCDFITKLYNTGLFAYVINKASDEVEWVLKATGMGYKAMLVYLTAFRNPDEFPEVVQALFNQKKSDKLEDLFELFQQLLIQSALGKNNMQGRHGNAGGHGLMYNYQWMRGAEAPKTISLKEFQTRLQHRKPVEVHDYFNPDIKYEQKQAA